MDHQRKIRVALTKAGAYGAMLGVNCELKRLLRLREQRADHAGRPVLRAYQSTFLGRGSPRIRARVFSTLRALSVHHVNPAQIFFRLPCVLGLP